MFRISENGVIELDRGDDFAAPIFLNAGSKTSYSRFLLRPSDRLYFAIMRPHEPFEDAAVKKVLSYADENEDGDPVIRLGCDDTRALSPGVYYYEIKVDLQENDGGCHVKTVRGKTRFVLM